jgi:hypothetical protein
VPRFQRLPPQITLENGQPARALALRRRMVSSRSVSAFDARRPQNPSSKKRIDLILVGSAASFLEFRRNHLHERATIGGPCRRHLCLRELLCLSLSSLSSPPRAATKKIRSIVTEIRNVPSAPRGARSLRPMCAATRWLTSVIPDARQTTTASPSQVSRPTCAAIRSMATASCQDSSLTRGPTVLVSMGTWASTRAAMRMGPDANPRWARTCGIR